MKELRTFEGFLDADSEHNQIAKNSYLRAVNFRLDQSGRMVSILSNSLHSNPYLPVSGNTTIGAVAEEQYIVQFVHNTTAADNYIFLFYKPTATWYKVLRGADLSFSADKLIQAAVINNILYWTDGEVEPRKVNLAAAITYNHGSSPFPSEWAWVDSMNEIEWALIRRSPSCAPSIQKATDGSYVNNFIGNDSFQFCLQYLYWDGEASVLSPLSAASRLNASGETYNKITVTVPFMETVRESVRKVRLIVKGDGDPNTKNENSYYVAKEWLSSDSEVADHNNGVTPLTFDFYGDVRGETIAPSLAAKSFDSVPLKTGTLEIIKNRLFLGDNTEGYNQVSDTSLTLSTTSITGGATSLSKELIKVTIGKQKILPNVAFAYTAWMVYMTEILPVGYYAVTSTELSNETYPYTPPTLGAAPTTSAITGLTFKGRTMEDVVNAVTPSSYTSVGGSGVVVVDIKSFVRDLSPFTVTGITTVTYNTFKSSSIYQGCVQFYDRHFRPVGGVVTKDSLKVNIPARDYAFSTGIGAINWELPSGAQPEEIPEEAAYYTVGLSKNLRTRYFTQHYDDVAKYATRDSNGDYEYPGTTFASNVVGIAINTTALLQNNLGYSFEEGDMCILVDDAGNVNTLPVVELNTDGKVILTPKDIGNLSGKKFIVELYKPYKPSTEEAFFEMGEIFPVSNAGTGTRAFAQTFGAFAPDAFCLTRNYAAATYFAEAMCPNDKFYQRWDTDHGRILLKVDGGEVRKKTSVKFSNVYVPGTQTNGLSSFEALNEELLPFDMGAVEKLRATSKVEGEGNVLLAIGENQTASLYIGETQVTNADTSSYFIKSSGVLGQINILKGDYGTQNPESVVLFNGNVFWLDVKRGCFVEYSVNGMDNISKGQTGVFKFSRFTKAWCDKYLSLSSSDFTALGSRPFVFGGVDPFHGEILWSLPKLATTAPNGILADYDPAPAYVNPMYPYDMLDYQAKTVAFKKDPARWMGEYSYCADSFVSIGSELYSFGSGALWKHNVEGSYNNFYGIPHRSQVMFPFNADNTIKEYQSLRVESNVAPEWTHLRSEYPYEQSSDLVETEWELKEGVWEAAILRDRLSPNTTGTYEEKLFKGEVMRNKAMLCLLQFKNEEVWLRLASVNYNNSSIQ